MVIPIQSAEEATSIALSFLRRYYYFVQPKAAKRTNGTWVVQADVAVVGEKIANVVVDSETRTIISYELPMRAQKV